MPQAVPLQESNCVFEKIGESLSIPVTRIRYLSGVRSRRAGIGKDPTWIRDPLTRDDFFRETTESWTKRVFLSAWGEETIWFPPEVTVLVLPKFRGNWARSTTLSNMWWRGGAGSTWNPGRGSLDFDVPASSNEWAPKYFLESARQRLPAYKVPRRVLTMPSLLMRWSGKPDR